MGQKRPLFMDRGVLARIEQIENSPEKRATLQAIKASMVARVDAQKKLILVGVVGVIVLSGVLRRGGMLVIALALGAYYLHSQSVALKRKNTASYVDNFLLPVMREVLPDVEIDYEGGIDSRVLNDVTPKTKKRSAFCHISFNDVYRTEFCNLWSYHTYEDSDGESHTVNDFIGQVLRAQYGTGLRGHIRVVPTEKGLLGREKQPGYDSARRGEKKIETEDIRFNETFNVYCTDEVSSRTLLNPYLLRALVEYREMCPVTVTMDESSVAVAFYTNGYILGRPQNKQEIEALSLSGEYQKVQNQLGKFYELLDTVNSQL